MRIALLQAQSIAGAFSKNVSQIRNAAKKKCARRSESLGNRLVYTKIYSSKLERQKLRHPLPSFIRDLPIIKRPAFTIICLRFHKRMRSISIGD